MAKDPISMAASILYLVNLAEEEKPPRTQADMARAAGITAVTVRSSSKDLAKKLGIRHAGSIDAKREVSTQTKQDP